MRQNLILQELISESVPYIGAFPRANYACKLTTATEQARLVPCDSLKDGESAEAGLVCSAGQDTTTLYILLCCVKLYVKTLFTINTFFLSAIYIKYNNIGGLS